MEITHQTVHETEQSSLSPGAEGYLSVKEAAKIMGVSTRSVYGYIEAGKLPGARIGSATVVHMDTLRAYQRKPAGRVRVRVPAWHLPPQGNVQYLTNVSVCIRQGQSERLDQRLADMRADGKHLMPGTAARYIVRSQSEPETIQIIFVWRQLVMPPLEERQAAFAALRADLADILDWETAIYQEGQVVLSA
ncbi:MAG TPA: helix-turn-helix domain-containing protein [Ktedonobacteraceae bacterium]|nr:helix-turn-helix domain-containing protein [Ktedonobacteraceae bacterium]